VALGLAAVAAVAAAQPLDECSSSNNHGRGIPESHCAPDGVFAGSSVPMDRIMIQVMEMRDALDVDGSRDFDQETSWNATVEDPLVRQLGTPHGIPLLQRNHGAIASHSALVQGDMVADDWWARRSLLEAIAIKTKWVGNLWPEVSAIPYCFAANFLTKSQMGVRAAIARIEAAVPCLRFQQIDSRQDVCSNSPAILFGHADRDTCFSQVGVQRARGPTRTFLGSGSDSQCLRLGAAVHEVLHALGMLHEHSAAPGNRGSGLTVNEASILARMYNCAAQRAAPKIGSMISLQDVSVVNVFESDRQKSMITVHEDDVERFQVVDAGPATVALWNTNSHRFLVMDPAGRLGASAVCPTAQLPTTRRWDWAKFTAVDTASGGTALYSVEHDRFLRLNPWGGIADAGHRSALRRSDNRAALPPDDLSPWGLPSSGEWNFEPFSKSLQVRYKLLFNGCCSGAEPVDESPALTFEECQAQCTADWTCDAIEVSACSMDYSTEIQPCRGHCQLFAAPAPQQFLSSPCDADKHIQCYEKAWRH